MRQAWVMANKLGSAKIVGSKATEDGLLVKFNDGSFYVFHTSFLVENRESHGDRIQNPSAWFAENWKKHPVDAGVISQRL